MSTLAMEGTPLTQVPPLTVLVMVIVAPTHTLVGPPIVPADGFGNTVTV